MGNRVVYLPAYEAEVEYLEGDGNSYIDTGLKVSSDLGILAHIRFSSTKRWLFGGSNGFENKALSFFIDDTSGSYRYDTQSINLGGLSLNTTYGFDNTQNQNVMKVGSLTFTVTASTFTSDYNFYLFAENRADVPTTSLGTRIYDFKIYSGSTLVRDFIPVRIGQIGYMYDKVTKQLFANKGTGQFTLGNDVSNAIPQQRCVLYFDNQRSVIYERIYEEYEWLCGRNGAYIDTNYKIVTVQDVLQGKIRYDGNIENPDGGKQYICGTAIVGIGNPYVYTYINASNLLGCIYKLHDNKWHYTSESNEHTFILSNDGNQTTAIDNGATYIFNNQLSEQLIDNSCYLFRANRPTSSYFHGDISYFRITDPTFTIDKVNMTPCKLLQPIPAILDGNGIARQAGEYGMWDKVSNKFYGNVSEYGTFTAKKPKCYEEFEWLVFDYDGSSSKKFLNLPINSYDFQFTRSYSTISNNAYFVTGDEEYSYGASSDSNICRIWDYTNRLSVYSMNVEFPPDKTINVNSTSNELLINNNVVPFYGYPQVKITWRTEAISFRNSAITVDGSVRYVPCKLTHGIPASMDANGIARLSGECGMWDKVNDKFYGNIAAGGNFTVSND